MLFRSNYKEDIPLICPMYYDYPDERAAYQVSNQYLFGSELLIAPITSKRIRGLNAASVTAWLPEGIWYDIYTGMRYEGGRSMALYRGLDSIPVLAKAGGILPFTKEISPKEAVKNPDSLWIRVYAGADGEFTLYEDDNETCGYEKGICAETRMSYREDMEEGRGVFRIYPVSGDASLIPERRTYQVELTGFLREACGKVKAEADGRALEIGEEGDLAVRYVEEKQAVFVELCQVSTECLVEIFLPLELRTEGNRVEERVFRFLAQAEIEFQQKNEIYQVIRSGKTVPVMLAQLNGMELGEGLYGVLVEMLTA